MRGGWNEEDLTPAFHRSPTASRRSGCWARHRTRASCSDGTDRLMLVRPDRRPRIALRRPPSLALPSKSASGTRSGRGPNPSAVARPSTRSAGSMPTYCVLPRQMRYSSQLKGTRQRPARTMGMHHHPGGVRSSSGAGHPGQTSMTTVTRHCHPAASSHGSPPS